MTVMMSLVTICLHTNIIRSLTIFPTLCISYLWFIYFATENLYLLLSLTYFSPPPHPPQPLATTCLFSVSLTVSVWLCSFICFYLLESTYKWHHTVFVFVWFISLSIRSSRSFHVVANVKISFFFMANIPLLICTTSSLSIRLSMGTYVVSISWLLWIMLQ